MLKDRLQSLKDTQVVIRANGFAYRGLLIEVTAEYAFIRTQTGHAQIPMERIQSIRGAHEAGPTLAQVESGYFQEVERDPTALSATPTQATETDITVDPTDLSGRKDEQ